MASIEVDPISPCARYLEFYFNDQYLACGTGFFVARDRRSYLVSNLHNFSGRNTFTGECLSKTLAVPNQVRFHVFKNGDLNAPILVVADLINEAGGPRYLQHFHRDSPIDIAALEVEISSTDAMPINHIPQEKLRIAVGASVFILGFPAGVLNRATPIWKGGTVASEPQIDFQGWPCFLVDSSTVKGMSGSPVILRSNHLESPSGVIQSTSHLERVIGIYSGRMPPVNAVETSLGYVWRLHCIYEVIDQKVVSPDYWDRVVPRQLRTLPPGWRE